MRSSLLAALLALLAAAQLFAAGPRARPRPALDCWFVDSLIKIFSDDPPDSKRLAEALFPAARRSHLSIQLALRAPRDLPAIRVEAPPLTGPGGWLESIRVRWVEYVVVKSNTPKTPDEELVRKAPGLFPDALLEQFPIDLRGDQTRSLWLTVDVPASLKPGLYKGRVSVRQGRKELARVPYAVRVYAATLPERSPLAINQYFNLNEQHIGRFYGVSRFSPGWWDLIGNIARFLADYHQDVMSASSVAMATARVEGGEVRYDFGNLERFFQAFVEAGVDRYLDGGNLLRRERVRGAPIMVPAWVPEGDHAVLRQLPLADPRAQHFLETFLPALYGRLAQKGWTGKYIQGVMDEPNEGEHEPFAQAAAQVARLMPGVRMIEPVGLGQDMEFMKPVDIWVALLGTIDDKLDVLDRHVRGGGMVWLYTALSPRGKYPNRFIDFPLLKVRLLHWINFKYGYRGFLHWGGNYWGAEPFQDTQPIINQGRTLLPPGDAYITYPSRAGLGLYSSIRLEQMREGIEDFALLDELSKKDPDKARKIAGEAVQSFTEYVRDPAAFRRIHQALLDSF